MVVYYPAKKDMTQIILFSAIPLPHQKIADRHTENHLLAYCPTVCVTGTGSGVDSLCELEKPKPEMGIVNTAKSLASDAHDVGLLWILFFIFL
jgi:hypothetical protein